MFYLGILEFGIEDELLVEGAIKANGENSGNDSAGGGSGGSIIDI